MAPPPVCMRRLLCCNIKAAVLFSYGWPHGAGTILLVAAEHISMLYIGRVLLGFGVGFAIQVSC